MNLKRQGDAWLDRIFKSVIGFAVLGLIILLLGVFLIQKMFQDILSNGTNPGGTPAQQTPAKKN
jgi:hypothetical protein